MGSGHHADNPFSQDDADARYIEESGDQMAGAWRYKDEATLPAGATTPDVSAGNSFVTANISATPIVDLVTAGTGHRIWLRINDPFTTLVHTADLALPNGRDQNPLPGEVYCFEDVGGVWILVAHYYGSDYARFRFHQVPATGGHMNSYMRVDATVSRDLEIANTLCGIPYNTGPGYTIDRILLQVSTLIAASTARAGIYAEDQANPGFPGALLIDGGSFATATTGQKNIDIADTILPPGIVFLGLTVSHAGVLFYGTPPWQTGGSFYGLSSLLTGNAGVKATTTGQEAPGSALPDPFPAHANRITGGAPLMTCRIA